MSAGDGVKRVKSREFTGISSLQLAGTGVKLVKTRVVFVGKTSFCIMVDNITHSCTSHIQTAQDISTSRF